MDNSSAESSYSIEFRKETCAKLGGYIRNRHSVNLVGMIRVGISHFLRFYLNHPLICQTYIDDKKSSYKHLFIQVDLNDLVERELYPFWILTLKRILDTAENSSAESNLKKYLQNLFLDSIQSKDLFLLMDNVRSALIKITEAGFLPTIFLIRFDRIKDALTPTFLSNLEGLWEASKHQVVFVFTTYRELKVLAPTVFSRVTLSLVPKVMYLPLANTEDMDIVFENHIKKHHLPLNNQLKRSLFELVGGHIQYLQLALLLISEGKKIKSQDKLFKSLIKSDRINLQSEELWESLTAQEQNTLIKVIKGGKISPSEKQTSAYLWDTGLVSKGKIFSPIFEHFLINRSRFLENESLKDFSKKELLLYNLLLDNLGKVCERETIIETVWPEEKELGVSDWAIDRLVSRVRNKLKSQNSQYLLITVKTRGFKLASNG